MCQKVRYQRVPSIHIPYTRVRDSLGKNLSRQSKQHQPIRQSQSHHVQNLPLIQQGGKVQCL